MDRFNLGTVKVHRIEEWRGTFSPPAELFAGFTPEGWDPHAEEFAPEYYDPASGKLFAFLQSWVLDTGTQRILFDTGARNDKDRPNLQIFGNLQTDFLGNLARAGFCPEDIDVVVCSHIHVDHVGWNTRLVEGRWEPTFHNARYRPAAGRPRLLGPAGCGFRAGRHRRDGECRHVRRQCAPDHRGRPRRMGRGRLRGGRGPHFALMSRTHAGQHDARSAGRR